MSSTSDKSPWIIETTDATFERDVIERSKEVPVVVDFWAAWCQPCRSLAPVLEGLAKEYAGAFILVKANTDETPSAATAFSVQGIPAVYGLRDGALVDYFQGVMPEGQIRQWLERVLPSEGDALLAEAKKLAESDPAAAEEKFRAAIEASPRDITPQLDFVRFLMDADRLEEAHALLTPLHEDGYVGDVLNLLSAVEVKLSGEKSGGVDACRAASQADPQNLELKLKLAEALVAEEQYEEALATALSLVQTDRAKFGEPARQLMIGVFNLLPGDSELTREYRRKLSTALY